MAPFGAESPTFLAYESAGRIVVAKILISVLHQWHMLAAFVVSCVPFPGVFVLNLVQNSSIISCGACFFDFLVVAVVEALGVTDSDKSPWHRFIIVRTSSTSGPKKVAMI
jgi:hypothetical protein